MTNQNPKPVGNPPTIEERLAQAEFDCGMWRGLYEDLQDNANQIARMFDDAKRLSLSELLRSTRQLHERFGVAFDVEIAERLCAEEFLELIRASTDEIWRTEFDVPKSESSSVIHEAVDLFVVVLGLLQAHGVSDAMLADAIAAVIAKNDAKTEATHELVNGKITRKAVQP